MAIAHVTSPAGATNTVSPITTGAVTPAAGTIAVVAPGDASTGGVKTFVPSSTPSSTYTRKATNATEAIELWVSQSLANSSTTWSCTDSGTIFHWGLVVGLFTGVDTTSPVGAVNNGGTSTTNNLTVNAITTTVDGSYVVGAAVDDSGDSAGGAYTSTDQFVAADDMIFVWKSAPTPTAGTVVTLNFDAGGAAAAAHRWVAIELLPAAAASTPNSAQVHDRDRRRATRPVQGGRVLRDQGPSRGREPRSQFDLYHAATAPISADVSVVGVLYSGAVPYAPATHDTSVVGHLPAATLPYSPISHDVSTVAHLASGAPQVSASGTLAYIVVGYLASGAPLFAPVGHDVPVAGHLASGAPQYGPISHNISVAGHLPTGTVSYSPVTHDTSVAGHLASGSIWYGLVSGSSDVNVVGILFSGTALYGTVSHTTSVPALLTVGTDLRATVSHTTSVAGHLSTGTFPLAVVSHNVSLVGYLPSGTALYAISGAFGAIPTITYPTAFVVLPNSRLGVDLAPSGLTVELASSSLIFVAGPSGLLVPLTPPNENLDLS